MTATSHVVRELTGYMRLHPAESSPLIPLYDAIRDHVQRGLCTHPGRCPVITAGALVVNEEDCALALWDGERYVFPEALLEGGDDSLRDTATRALTLAGVRETWAAPGLDGPFLIDLSPAAPQDARTRYCFRYLYRAHSDGLLPATLENGKAAWFPLADIGTPGFVRRFKSHLAAF
jgi:hypothetical protein